MVFEGVRGAVGVEGECDQNRKVPMLTVQMGDCIKLLEISMKESEGQDNFHDNSLLLSANIKDLLEKESGLLGCHKASDARQPNVEVGGKKAGVEVLDD